jgi:hypothetical protein
MFATRFYRELGKDANREVRGQGSGRKLTVNASVEEERLRPEV